VSAQTGSHSLPPPPPESRGMQRVRGQVDHWQSAPNPILIRELKQAARLTRTPFILMTLTAMAALLLCSIGGLASLSLDPARTGVAIFHTFFSLAYFVVTLAGPALASNSIASERDGRTWEALLLTGLSPGIVARGKFLAAFTNIAMYIVMLAPVGALPFLFGGVSAIEIVLAFVWLFLLASLSVAFGLALSSKMDSSRSAIVVTLLFTFVLSPTIYFTGGVGFSSLANDLWPAVTSGPPIWLPTAYVRAPFDLRYFLLLIVVPLLSVLLPSWFLYEVTVANLTSITDDRSTGIRRWFFVTNALVVVPLVVASATPVLVGVGLATAAYGSFLIFMALVFCGEPIGPSRRVLRDWDASGAGALRRFFGPGVMRASTLLLLLGSASLLLFGLTAAISYAALGVVDASRQSLGAAVVALYSVGFLLFTGGLSAWARARTNAPGAARGIVVVALFLIAAGPWIIAAMAGVALRPAGDTALLIAAPSPFFLIHVLDRVTREATAMSPPVLAALVAAAAWALLGLSLLGRAAMKCRSVIAAHDAAIEQGEAMLRAEDEAIERERAEAAALAEGGSVIASS
jgi:ABC-type transport system involved in multi-copper enzyme maturation permease subunit